MGHGPDKILKIPKHIKCVFTNDGFGDFRFYHTRVCSSVLFGVILFLMFRRLGGLYVSRITQKTTVWISKELGGRDGEMDQERIPFHFGSDQGIHPRFLQHCEIILDIFANFPRE